jgi:hypothetical protein
MPRCHDTTRPALSLKRLEKHALSQFRSAQIGFPESSVAKIAVPVGGPRSKWLLSKRGKKDHRHRDSNLSLWNRSSTRRKFLPLDHRRRTRSGLRRSHVHSFKFQDESFERKRRPLFFTRTEPANLQAMSAFAAVAKWMKRPSSEREVAGSIPGERISFCLSLPLCNDSSLELKRQRH